jgi:hypothetical protein
MNLLRFDFIFSYWIFTWYLLYEFKITTYNPKFALIVALINNIFTLLFMLIYLNDTLNIISFITINFFIKIIPLWRLRNSNNYDIISSIKLYIIYNIWLLINNTNIYKLYITQYINIINNKPIGPLNNLITSIIKK